MKDIAKACRSLLIEEPFYGYFLLNLNKRYSEDLPTAGVSMEGINTSLAINKEFWKNLTEAHRLGILKHELLHICFFHLELRHSYGDPKLFNIAADIEVNQYINSKNLPEGAFSINTFPSIELEARKGTAYYYEKLRQNMSKPKKPNPQSKEGGESGGEGVTTPSKGGSDSGKGGTCSGGGRQVPSTTAGDPDGDSNDNSQFRDELLDKMMQKSDHHFTWKWYEGLSSAEKKLVRNQIEHTLKETARQSKKSIGSIPNEMKAYVDSLFENKEAVFNWKAYLRRFLGVSQEIYTRKTRRKLSKRFSENPGLKIKKKMHILVGVDTSGSVSVNELKEFFSEIYHIWKAGVQVTIVEADAAVGDVYKYDGKFKGSISGRGGTRFEPIIDFYNKNKALYTTLVYFTDGYAPTPTSKPSNKMMWVISSNGDPTCADLPGYVMQIPKS